LTRGGKRFLAFPSQRSPRAVEIGGSFVSVVNIK